MSVQEHISHSSCVWDTSIVVQRLVTHIWVLVHGVAAVALNGGREPPVIHLHSGDLRHLVVSPLSQRPAPPRSTTQALLALGQRREAQSGADAFGHSSFHLAPRPPRSTHRKFRYRQTVREYM